MIENVIVQKLVTQAAMSEFESVVWKRGRNVHNDPEMAASAGITAPFASGMFQLAFMHDLLRLHYGDRWNYGGAISARWLGLVFDGDVIAVTAREVEADFSDLWWHTPGATTLEIFCTNQSGTRTAAARAEIPAAVTEKEKERP